MSSAPLLSLPPWLSTLVRQLGLVAGITLAVSTGLVLVFRQSWTTTLIYSFLISMSCAICVQALSHGSRWLLARRKPGQELGWPGWPLMIFSLVVGTWLGYSIGNELANALTGNNSAGLHNSSLRRALTIMLISLIPGFALTFFYIGRSRIADAEARAQSLQRQAAEAQLRLLASQLEPHMLFNTLANLRVLIGLDPVRAQAMLDRLIAFLRATLQASRSNAHPLREEFARLADYLALMQVRMGARLRTELYLPAELTELPVPPLLLQPLVENAIKHGLEPHVEGGLLRVSAAREGAQLVLEVRDTGAGLSATSGLGSTDISSSFGLEQVRSRLQTQYGAAASINISPANDGAGGTLVRISLPGDPSVFLAPTSPA